MRDSATAVKGASGGIGFFGMLTILFIGLKLTDNIDWSWMWVLGPLWIPLAAAVVILVGIVIIEAIWG